MAVDSIVYEDDQTESVIYLTVEPRESWKFKVSGTVIDSYLSNEWKAGDLKLQDFVTPKRRAKRGLTKFSAILQTDLATLQRLAQDYFSVSGYSHEDSE